MDSAPQTAFQIVRITLIPVVKTVRNAMQKIVTSREYQASLIRMGFTVEDAGTPESIRALLRERRANWQKVFDGLGVKPR